MLYSLCRRVLFSMQPETAHNVTMANLDWATHLGLHKLLTHMPDEDPVEVMGLRFPNTIGLAAGMDKDGIRVNAFGPGAMMTRMTARTRANPERVALFMNKLVDTRYGKPEEAAAVALFLASDEASFVNGALYYVTGGYRVL